eukprot:CAMPEP_0172361126 /NCGR_PEP_ID=MMETSP1060-20121228/5013_1 /TAXON_ID=37318 /ORGANISM="Pseudo-nitzschia pungens, Strain cf. cingulata" /LENGTH=1053 /DNA_ID=CAMNT_0013083295 /DNA_START=158 /DNA_END=3319 /DNA_ORIENTATION=-
MEYYLIAFFAYVLGRLVASSAAVAAAPEITSSTVHETHKSVHGGSHHRKFMPSKTECVLYLKAILWEDGPGSHSWACEFLPADAEALTGGVRMLDIHGITSEELEAKGALSGETVMRLDNKAYVERSATIENSGDGENSNYNRYKTEGSGSPLITIVVLRIPTDSKVDIESMDRVLDVRHARNKRARRERRLQAIDPSDPRVFEAMVVRVFDGNGTGPAANYLELSTDVFFDPICLRSQYAACSHGAVIVEPTDKFGSILNSTMFPGVKNGTFIPGIVDVYVDALATPGNHPNLENEAEIEASSRYAVGGMNETGSLANDFDFVLFCLPPGTGDWVAYAYVNDHRSYFNDKWCQRVSAQMHEIGHNLNLGHSGLPEQSSYADVSGMMGFAHEKDDAPIQCFNPAKSYQLGWYPLQIKSIDPLALLNETSPPLQFILNGVSDYAPDGSNGEALVSLRLENFGLLGGVDYYIGYNRASGCNSGTADAQNKVTVTEKENSINSLDGRDGFGKSRRLGTLDEGESFKIENFQNSIISIIVTVISIKGKNAAIEVAIKPPEPTAAPTTTPCDRGGNRFKVEFRTDEYGDETQLFLKMQGDDVYIDMGDRYLPLTTYGFPDLYSSYCLPPGVCFVFEIKDTMGDGMCCGYGDGYYKGFLDGELIFEGAEFDFEMVHVFCTPPPPTWAPTLFPTFSPTTPFPSASPSTPFPTVTPQPSTAFTSLSPSFLPSVSPSTPFPSVPASSIPSSLSTALTSTQLLNTIIGNVALLITASSNDAVDEIQAHLMNATYDAIERDTGVTVTLQLTETYCENGLDGKCTKASLVISAVVESENLRDQAQEDVENAISAVLNAISTGTFSTIYVVALAPTESPSRYPTSPPTSLPSMVPSAAPSFLPSTEPSESPSTAPSFPPTASPSRSPTENPTTKPSRIPTKNPTRSPTKKPTINPTKSPTKKPTTAPTKETLPEDKCSDCPDFRWKKQAKWTCSKVAKTGRRIKSICKTPAFAGSKYRVYDYCRETCGKVGKGPGSDCFENIALNKKKKKRKNKKKKTQNGSTLIV